MKRLELTAVLLLFHLLSLPQSPSASAPAWDKAKNCQPVVTTMAGGKNFPGSIIRVFNAYTSRDLSNVMLEWDVTLNGAVVQKGKLPVITVAAQHSGVFSLPAKVPAGEGEVFLNIHYRLKKAGSSLPAGSVIAREQLRMRAYNDDLSVHPAGELAFTDEGGTFTIASAATGLNMQFNKQSGWLQHYAMGARLLVEDSLGLITDGGQGAAEPKLQLFSTSTSSDLAVIKADYILPETPFLLHARYTINARGEIQVEQSLEVDTTQPRDSTVVQPPLKYPPLFGMKWGLPAGFDSVMYYGRVAPEHADSCHDMYTAVARGAFGGADEWTDVRWWKCTDGQGHGLLIAADSALLNIRISGRQINIGHPLISAGPDNNYHYIYKVMP